MKRLKLKRISESKLCTMGVLIDQDNGLPIMVTLERPYVENMKNISCIPEGIYACKPYSSAKYKSAFEVMNVPNRSHILIHIGNYAEDSKGCILLGQSYGLVDGNIPAVWTSKESMKKLKEITNNQDFELIISNS